MLRMFFAGTSVRPREWTYLNDATPLYSDSKNILVRNNENTKYKSYYFPGPLSKLSLDQGKYSISNNFERGVKILKNDIDKLLEEDSTQEITVEIAGHSRGGVAAGRVAKSIQEHYKNYNNITVKLISLDPVPGPGHFGDDKELELSANSRDIENRILIYSLETPMFHSPQIVKNVGTVIIQNTHHNGVYGSKSSASTSDTIDMYGFYYGNRKYSLSELYTLKGVYFCRKNSTRLIELDSNNLSECITMIYDTCDDNDRVSTILNSIIDVSDMSLDTMLENNPKYRENFEKVLDDISDTWFITSAYNKALDLFKNKSQFSKLINKEGDLYKYILDSSNSISGLKNKPQGAYNYLKSAQQNLNLGQNANKLVNTLKNRLKKRYDVY